MISRSSTIQRLNVLSEIWRDRRIPKYSKMHSADTKPQYEPTLIIHGGAGAISRENLPPRLYEEYRKSLTEYLVSTRKLLDEGASALEAACHAVSLLEDDPLFNCGRGSVFTKAGEIEMEASVMVASVSDSGPARGGIKRTGAVSRIRNTRHPILLAREVLLDADRWDGLGGTDTMHCHISGRGVEEWGWNERGLQRKEDDWFWTKRRWDEHRRGLDKLEGHAEATPLPSQGTVGAVCFDFYGSIAVATSTGGLTNKAPGRIGDTPSVGAGFWAENWATVKGASSFNTSSRPTQPSYFPRAAWATAAQAYLRNALGDCFASPIPSPALQNWLLDEKRSHAKCERRTHRAVAMSGTGNGDSFLRLNAARSAAAICRFASNSLQTAVTAIAGPGGELQESAGNRWMKTGEGQGGIIGVESADEVCSCGKNSRSTKAVFDFNCGGMWRALYMKDPATGAVIPKVMVFREEYEIEEK
jgi:L-asparaginase